MKIRWLAFPLAALLIASMPIIPRAWQADDLHQTYDDDFERLLSQATQKSGKQVMKYERMAPGLLAKRVTVTGTHYDFGYLVGLIARDYGMQMTRRTAASAEMNRRIVEMYQAIYPGYLEKARGIARAYDMTLDDVDFTYLEHPFEAELWWRMFKYQQFTDASSFAAHSQKIGCTLASCFLESERRHLVGRNFDYRAELPHFVIVSGLDGSYRTVGHSMFQMHQWMMDAVNEKGLFMGLASLGSPPEYASYADTSAYPDKPAVESHHLIRAVVDTCASVDEALTMIRKTRVWFPSGFIHFLLADAQGNSVVATFDRDKNLIVFPRQAPYNVLTNTALQEGVEYVYGHCWRYRTATDMLRRGVSSLPEMAEVMGAVRQKSGAARTLWTALTDLTKKEMVISYRSEDFAVPYAFSFSGTRLTWPQLALGGGYECTILLSNKRDSEWTGRFNLVQGNNGTWDGSWSLDGKDRTGASEFEVSISPQSTVKLRLAGDSVTRSGYLQMNAEGACSVYDVAPSYYYSYLSGGRMQTCTGSAPATSGRLFWFPVEKSPTANTGLAWAPDSVTAPFAIVVTLFGETGAQLQRKELTYTGHEARFFDEIFDGIPDRFLGRVRIESQENLHLEVLRLEQTDPGFLLTSTPADRMF